MATQPLLTDLCAICYTNPPKYRCPRCPGPVRTCSLPCYKRHQQRASCNGQRDPTAYVKKSDLVTPAGIDHDYNFLTGIERVLDKTEKDEGGKGRNSKGRHGKLYDYLRENRIVVDKAPTGMSRQKTNNTRWLPNSKRIVWTVEWIDVDGTKRLCEVDATASISEAYKLMLSEKERESKKRKRGEEPSERASAVTKVYGTSATKAEQVKTDVPAATNTPAGGAEIREQVPSVEPASEEVEPKPTASSQQPLPPDQTAGTDRSEETSTPATPDAAVQSASETSTTAQDKRSLIIQRMQEEKSRQAALRASKPSPPPRTTPYFYLSKPHIPNTSRVLIPLSDSESLTASLKNQVVLEFPTLYALMEAPEKLSEGFLTEENYLKLRKEEDAELEGMMSAVSGGRRMPLGGGIFGVHDRTDERGSSSAAGQWDEKRVLEMLRRDVPT